MSARKQERYTPINVLEAINLLSDESMGTVANISGGGFLLTTQDYQIGEGSIFQLVLREHVGTESTDIATLGAACLWHSEAASPNTFWSGFQIIDIQPEDEERLMLYIETLKH